LNTRTKQELKESQEPEKLLNTENKKELNKFQEKSQKLTIMPLNISDNTFHNMSQKKQLNMLPEKEKLKSTNISQLKDKSFTIQNNHLKSPLHLLIKLDIKFQVDNKSLEDKQLLVDIKLDIPEDILLEETLFTKLEETPFTKLDINKFQLDIKSENNTVQSHMDTPQPQTLNTLPEDQV